MHDDEAEKQYLTQEIGNPIQWALYPRKQNRYFELVQLVL